MFGVPILHHLGLQRLMNDYGFYEHPLVKAYPVIGLYEVYFCDLYLRLIYLPVASSVKVRRYFC